MIARSHFLIDQESRELVMMLADGDKLQYDSYMSTELMEFWGLVWEYERRSNRNKPKEDE